jgi:formate-dependent nitrite reductase membrane component NrfD
MRSRSKDAKRQAKEERDGKHVRTADGRNVDPALGTLAGEGADIQVRTPGTAWPIPTTAGEALAARAPSRTTSELATDDSYYGLPVVKAPVWKWYVPAYFYLGGAGGAAATLGAALQLVGGPRARRLTLRARYTALACFGAGSALLVADLGRPSRFLNMLRVFRPTSPMNVGTWLLATAATTTAVASMFTGDARTRGPLATIGDGAALVAGAFGAPVAGYTAVLLTNSAVPVWLHARRALPALFIASAVTSAAALLEAMPVRPHEARALRAFGTAGKVAELAAAHAVEREVARAPHVDAPLRRGVSGTMWRVAKLLTAASLVVSALPRPTRRRRVLAAALATGGALMTRFAFVQAGTASARDPRATFAPQRERADEREHGVSSLAPAE